MIQINIIYSCITFDFISSCCQYAFLTGCLVLKEKFLKFLLILIFIFLCYSILICFVFLKEGKSSLSVEPILGSYARKVIIMRTEVFASA